MTATIFELRGLRADNLQAFLALLGVLRVVDLQCPQWRARARWRNEAAGGLAEIEIEAENAVSESDFFTAIAKGANELLDSLVESIPETKKPETSDTVIAMAQEPENRENPRAAFVGVFAAPPPPPPPSMEKTKLPPPSMEKTKSPLFLLTGRQSCRTKAGDLAKLQERDYEAALREDWSYATSDEGGVSWDPSDRREHARCRTNPSGDTFAVEKGGLALAICGWPSFMPAPKMQGKKRKIVNTAPGWEGKRKLRKKSANAEKWQADLSWPLWESFADLPEIEASLADNCWRADEINRADMEARGVWLVMRAVRMHSREKTKTRRNFFGWANHAPVRERRRFDE